MRNLTEEEIKSDAWKLIYGFIPFLISMLLIIIFGLVSIVSGAITDGSEKVAEWYLNFKFKGNDARPYQNK